MIINTFSNCYLKQRENPIYQYIQNTLLKRSYSMSMANNITDSIKHTHEIIPVYIEKDQQREYSNIIFM